MNAEISYNITDGNKDKMFDVNDRGEIFNAKSLDYEGKEDTLSPFKSYFP